MKKALVRVGVLNNFNYSEEEIKVLHIYEKMFPQYDFFVNSNSFVTIKSDFPSIVTINPYLTFVEPKGDLSNIKAVRVKIVVDANDKTYENENEAVRWAVNNNIPVLITWQRFKSLKTLFTYTDSRESYNNVRSYLRPQKTYRDERFKELQYLFENKAGLLFQCDEQGKGCPSCNNCSRLITGDIYEVYSLNLKASGVCLFHCPDCFAKACCSRCHNNIFDNIKMNRKQKGKIK